MGLLSSYTWNACRIILKKTTINHYFDCLATIASLSDEEIIKVNETLTALENIEYALNDKTIQKILDNPDEGQIYTVWLRNFTLKTNNHRSQYIEVGDIPLIVIPLLKAHGDFVNEIALAFYALKRVNLLDETYIALIMNYIVRFKNANDRKKITYFVELVNRLKLGDATYEPEQQFQNIMALANSHHWDEVAETVYGCKCTPIMIATLLHYPQYAKSYAESILFYKTKYNGNIAKIQNVNQYIELFSQKDNVQFSSQLIRGASYLNIQNIITSTNINTLLANKSNAEAIGRVLASVELNQSRSEYIKDHSQEIIQLCLAEKQNFFQFSAGVLVLYLCAGRYAEIRTMLNDYIERLRENKKFGELFGICIQKMLDMRLDIPTHLEAIFTNIQHAGKLTIGLEIFLGYENEFESEIEDRQQRFTAQNFRQLIAHIVYADKLAKGMVILKEHQLLFNHQEELILNISCADDYAKGLIAIREFPLTIRSLNLSEDKMEFAQNILKFLKSNVQHAEQIIKLFHLLIAGDININQLHFEKMIQHIMYINEIVKILEIFRNNHQLNLSNIKTVVDYFDHQISDNPHQIAQNKKLLNILIYTFNEIANANQLTESLIRKIIAHPQFATVIALDHGIQAKYQNPIPRAIIRLNHAVNQVLVFASTRVGRMFNNAIILNICLHLAGDLQVLDENTRHTLLSMRWIKQQRILYRDEKSKEIQSPGTDMTLSLFNNSTTHCF
ncbi:MAG: hypothetical protein ABSF18_05410 [Gammaproteobacteria bacterium]|jgi:hypothetical protein